MEQRPADWSQFALVLIDLQEDFWSERLAQAFPCFASSIVQALDLCRQEGIEVVHVRSLFRPDQSDWMPFHRLRGKVPCIEGSPGARALPFAQERPGERVIVKRTFDAFHCPELLQHLASTGKRFVISGGLLTSICVLLTTVSAVQQGFLAAVLEDCCADQPDRHEQSLALYGFLFDRLTTGQIRERYSEWSTRLERLDCHPSRQP